VGSPVGHGGDLLSWERHQRVGAVDAQSVADELAEVGKNGLVVHELSELGIDVEQPAQLLVPLVPIGDAFGPKPIESPVV
jgi:hypothetical protein